MMSLSSQITLFHKVPTHVMLPIFLLLTVGFVPDLLDGSNGEPTMLPYVILGLSAVALTGAALVVKKKIGKQLQTLLDKFTKLEEELQEI